MKKKQSKKLLLHKTTVNNLVQIRGGAAVVSQYPTRDCDTKENTCKRSCKGMVSCLHACNSYPDDNANGCYTDPKPIGTVIEDNVML
jgi:hypothetical protein